MILSRIPSRGRLLISRRQLTVWACTFGVGVLFLFAWELASRAGTIDSVFYSKPTDIVVRLWQDLLGAEVYGRTIYEQIWITTEAVLIGYVAGAAGGVLVGFAVGRSKWLSRALEPYILTFYAIPKIAIALLFILILGIGLESKVAIVAMESFFILFMSTIRGVLEIDEQLVQIARIMVFAPHGPRPHPDARLAARHLLGAAAGRSVRRHRRRARRVHRIEPRLGLAGSLLGFVTRRDRSLHRDRHPGRTHLAPYTDRFPFCRGNGPLAAEEPGTAHRLGASGRRPGAGGREMTLSAPTVPDVALHCPDTVEEVLALLAAHGEDAKLVAGGTAFTILWRAGLLSAGHLVACTRLPGLDGITVDGDIVTLGALARLRSTEVSGEVRSRLPVLTAALGHVGNLRVRNAATWGGNVAEADNTSDLAC